MVSRKETVTLIHNIGTLVSGDIDNPVLPADSVLIRGKLIERIGSYDEFKAEKADYDIDIQGMTLCPGLIDGHSHPVIGDWTPRVKALGWMEGALHGGVTTLVSQGEHVFPGKPTDVAGVKALAILARKVYNNYRPGGIKAHAGALLLEEGLTEKDIEEMAKEGVWLFAEVGSGGLKDFGEIYKLAQTAKRLGFKIPAHFGPESVPGVKGLSTDEMIRFNPDIVSHFNGGPISCSFAEMKRVARECSAFLEMVANGNLKAAVYAVNLLRERNELHRIVLGTDSPTGLGVVPLGIIRLVAQISSLCDIAPAVALGMATGNTARAYGLNTGTVKPGKEADFLVIDAPPGSQSRTALEAIGYGDPPNMGMVMVDGRVVTRIMKRALNTARKVLVNGEPDPRKVSEEMWG